MQRGNRSRGLGLNGGLAKKLWWENPHQCTHTFLFLTFHMLFLSLCSLCDIFRTREEGDEAESAAHLFVSTD